MNERVKMAKFVQAASDDADKLKQIVRRVILHNYVSFLGAEVVNEFLARGMADKEIDDGIDNCTVMILNNNIVGFSITKEDLLHLIMIDTPHQNKGYGSKLLNNIEKILFEKYSTLALQTFKENKYAVQFCLNKGWVITEEQDMPELNKTMLFFEKKKERLFFLTTHR